LLTVSRHQLVCAALLLLSTQRLAWSLEPDWMAVDHTPVIRARPGVDIPIKAQLAIEIAAAKVLVLYRSTGQGDYVALALVRRGASDWVGAIPAEAVSGRSMQYYLEVHDVRGRTIEGSGSAAHPHLVTLSESAPGAQRTEVEVDDPEARERQRRQREAEEKRSSKRFDRLFLFVMPGFGFGYQPTGNRTELSWQLQTTPDESGNAHFAPSAVASPGGVTIAPFHLALEVGGLITRHFSLSLFGRFELVTGANADSSGAMDTHGSKKATGAISGFLRARYRFLDGAFHPYVHFDIGGGEIRHALDVSTAQARGNLVDRYAAESFNVMDKSHLTTHTVCTPGASCIDSILLGYVFIGGGAGLWYDVAEHIALLLDVNLLGALGSGGAAQRGLNVDVQIGLGVHFL
jgi:hypothetical protein